MTENELMEMAREAGALIMEGNDGRLCAGDVVFYDGDCLENFANAILERAAVECEKKNVIYLKASADQGGDADFEGAAAGARQCANGIRALKIDNQAQSAAAHKGEAP